MSSGLRPLAWRGVNCTEEGDHVTGLILAEVGMNVSLLSAICNLSYLFEEYVIQQNNLRGEAPECSVDIFFKVPVVSSLAELQLAEVDVVVRRCSA
mmetsp:Transcript_4123/g.7571  ORF Transcript_4123/g.7571 Transcript_4123/m.7571 type:complete len:96 (+) Transcript_4123:2-289(+)